MIRPQTNPYAIYVNCDASMAYEPHNPGGVGVVITFPEQVDLQEITHILGRYEGANIERLELEAISKGMDLLTSKFQDEKEKLQSVKVVVIVTDRQGLDDSYKTSAFHIRDWRHNKWKNFECKPIKNSDLLDEIDKKRKKLSQVGHCTVEIQYQRRKYNRKANNAAAKGRKKDIVDKSIEVKGLKICKRKYSGQDIDYSSLKEGDKFPLRIYMKQPVRDEWEISGEICEGKNEGEIIVFYTDNETEVNLHRHHIYRLTVKKVLLHHIRISDEVIELSNAKN